MAHIAKYKAPSVGHMLAHYRRDRSSLERDNIDPERIENMMGGYVHKDEVLKDGTPARDHMHVPFTPILDGRFNYKQMCPRSFYQSMHKELGDYLEGRMGYRPAIELDEETRAQRVYTDKSVDIDKVRCAVDKAVVEPAKDEAAQSSITSLLSAMDSRAASEQELRECESKWKSLEAEYRARSNI